MRGGGSYQVPYFDDFRRDHAFSTDGSVRCLQLRRAVAGCSIRLVDLLGQVRLARVLLLAEHGRYRVVVFYLDVHHWVASSLHPLEDYLVGRCRTIPHRSVDSLHTAGCSVILPCGLRLRCRLSRGSSVASFGVEGARVAHSIYVATLNNLPDDLLSRLPSPSTLHKVRHNQFLLLPA